MTVLTSPLGPKTRFPAFSQASLNSIFSQSPLLLWLTLHAQLSRVRAGPNKLTVTYFFKVHSLYRTDIIHHLTCQVLPSWQDLNHHLQTHHQIQLSARRYHHKNLGFVKLCSKRQSKFYYRHCFEEKQYPIPRASKFKQEKGYKHPLCVNEKSDHQF